MTTTPTTPTTPTRRNTLPRAPTARDVAVYLERKGWDTWCWDDEDDGERKFAGCPPYPEGSERLKTRAHQSLVRRLKSRGLIKYYGLDNELAHSMYLILAPTTVRE